jgi:uncharacterized lipoprotein NlpE involved in copper resistance
MSRHLLIAFLVFLVVVGCKSRQTQSMQEPAVETAEIDDTADASVTTDTDFTIEENYLYMVSNGDTVDFSTNSWNVELVNGKFNAAVQTQKLRSFQLDGIDILELEEGQGTLQTGSVVYVNPTALPLKKRIANTTAKYNRSSFGGYEKILIIGSGEFQQNDSAVVFSYGFVESFPDSQIIDEYEEEYIDEE